MAVATTDSTDQPTRTPDRTAERPNHRATISPRVYVLSATFIILSCLWVRESEILTATTMVSESAPPIPALATIILLVAINPLLRLARLQLSRSEILFVYAAVCIGATIPGHGVIKSLFPALAVPFYFATPENGFERIRQVLPTWFIPHRYETLRLLYEGSETARVPWSDWAVPLLTWTIFFAVFFWTLMCVMVVLRKQWVENERLTFPLLYLPLDLVQEQTNHRTTQPPFFRDPLMWTGIAISFVYNALNILNAYNPSVASLGTGYNIGALLTERPLSAVNPLWFYYRLDLTGLGYLVPLDISFSIWFFHLLMRGEAVMMSAVGYQVAGMPFDQEQGAGAYLALPIFLLWTARGHLRVVVATLLKPSPPSPLPQVGEGGCHGEESHLRESEAKSKRLPSPVYGRGVGGEGEPLTYRTAVIGGLIGFALLIAFCTTAGMMTWLAVIYFTVIFAFALVYARIRAETGPPMIWLFPFYQQKKVITNAFGSARLGADGFRSLTIMSSLYWLSRGYFSSLIGYQVDNFKLADEARVHRRSVVPLMFFALMVGLVCSYWIFLTSYYRYGANILEGGTVQGGYRTTVALAEYNELAGWMKTPKGTDWWRTGFSIGGFMFASALCALRTIFLKCPFHPLGYAMATAYGTRIWGPFFLVWMLKWLIVRFGGASLYRRCIPFFIGLALGHYFTAGIVWGILGTVIDPTGRRYMVGFG